LIGENLTLKAPFKLIAISLLLGAAGFLGNWYKLQLFFNVDFLFGSFFVMLAIARCGVAGGVTAGLLAGSCSYLLWNHPWAIIIFTGEALFVALLNRRRLGNLVTLDTIYWLCLGMPQVWVFYHLVMGTGNQATLLVALKQSVNGIFNAMLATILLYAMQLSRPARHDKENLIPFRQLIFIGMVSVSLIPAFVYLVTDLRRTISSEEETTRKRVLSIAENARGILNVWITGNHQPIIALSQLVGDPDVTPFPEMQTRVETLKKANPYLLRMGVINSASVSVAFSPTVDNLGKSSIGVDFSDRPFIPTLQKMLKPMLGDVVMGRIGTPAPALPLLAPIVVNGSYRGYCAGIVNLDRLADQLRILAKGSFCEITVIDRRGRVVVSSSGRRQTMQTFGRPIGGEIRNLADGIYHWVPKPGKNISIMQRWRGSLFVKEVRLSEETPWTIVVEGSMLPYLDLLITRSIDQFLQLWGLIILTLAASHLLSKRFVVSLQGLATISTGLPRAIANNIEPSWPETRISELFSLVDNFRQMTAALGDNIRRLKELNEGLEKRVAERTEELCQSEERYSRLVNTANEGIWVINTEHRITYANQRLVDILGYSVKEIIGRHLEDFVAAEELSELAARLEHRRLGVSEQYESRMRKRDGSEIWLAMSAAPLFDAESRFYGSFAMCFDITERKRMREELQQANELLIQRVAERTAELSATIERLQDEINERSRLGQALEAETKERLNAQAELHENELLLIQQSRLAAMGEMIGNIAHQWRQPLNLLGLLAQELPMVYKKGDFTTEYLEANVQRMLETIRHMSKTIDDFRYFSRPSKQKVDFRILETIGKTISLLEGGLNAHNIKTAVVSACDPVVNGYPSEYSQVLLNIMINARDAFLAHEVTNPTITIEVGTDGGRCVVTITDNAGGIPEGIIDKIFDPYFTTKGPDKGTGVGLYMSKMIIEKMGGSLSARNVDGGAQFRIQV
jgi:PAS domain S-box-containing protein